MKTVTPTCVIVALILCVAAIVAVSKFITQRSETLRAEHAIRKQAVFAARQAGIQLYIDKSRDEIAYMEIGCSVTEAEARALTETLRAKLAQNRADRQRTQAALDAFYLIHPQYRDRD